MPILQDDRVAELVIERNLLTPQQVDACRQHQQASATPCSLAQAMVAKGVVSSDVLRRLMLDETMSGRAGSQGDPNASGPYASGGDDTDVAFGRYLIGKGLLTNDQAREAYRLLVGYRQKFPQVNLSQVLAKHDMVDKDQIRSAFGEFQAQNPSGSAFGSQYGSQDPGGSQGGAPSGSHFGYKTAELRPEDRPDYAGPPGGIPATIDPDATLAPPGGFAPGGIPATIDPDGGGFAPGGIPATIDPDSGFAPGGIPATIDPDGGYAPLGLGSGMGANAEDATLMDPGGSAYGSGPYGSAGPGGSAYGSGPYGSAGPGGSAYGDPYGSGGPGATNPYGSNPYGSGPYGSGGPGGSAYGSGPSGSAYGSGGPGGTSPYGTGPGGTSPYGTGPGGTSPYGTGPGGTSPYGTGAGSGALGLADGQPASPFQKQGPLAGGGTNVSALKDLAQSDEDEDDDTQVQSSTFGALGTRRGGGKRARKVVKRKQKPLGLYAVLGVGLILVVVIPFQMYLENRRVEEAKTSFLASYDANFPDNLDDLKAFVGTLPDKAAADPDVAKKIEEVNEALGARERREKAEEKLAQLEGLDTFEERLEVCNQALNEDENYAEALVARARVRFALAKRKALETEETSPSALVEPALKDLGQAEIINDALPGLHLFKAELLLFQGNRTQAITSLSKAKQYDPDGEYGALAEGLQEFVNRRVDRAIDAYNTSIQRNPKFVPAYLARARAFLAKYDYPNAQRDAEQASDLDSSNADALTLQAEARYLSSGDRERSGTLRDLRRALELDPSSSHALALQAYARLERDVIGMCVSGEGDLEACENDANMALRVSPDEHLAYLTKSEIAKARGDSNLALRLASTAVEKGTAMPEVYLWRGRLRGMMGDHEHCFNDLQQVLSKTEEVPGASGVRARALTIRAGVLAMEKKKYAEAQSELERAIDLDQNLPEAYFYRGYIFHMNERNQQLNNAVKDYSTAISKKPDFADALYHRAAARFDLDQWEDCLDDLEKAENLRSEGTGFFQIRFLYYIRAKSYYMMEDWEQALKWFNAYTKLAMPGEDAYDRSKELIAELEQKVGGGSGE